MPAGLTHPLNQLKYSCLLQHAFSLRKIFPALGVLSLLFPLLKFQTSQPLDDDMLDIISLWDPKWILSLSPLLGISFLFLVEKWLLSAPKSLPWWLGENKGFLPRISACLRDWKQSVPGLKAGYSRVSFSSHRYYLISKPLLTSTVRKQREILCQTGCSLPTRDYGASRIHSLDLGATSGRAFSSRGSI